MPEPLAAALLVFASASVVIAVAGTLMSRVADELADRTGLGEAVVGAFVLAAATSLPDFAATLSAAVDNRPNLAMSNVMGSMAVNLAFLGVADILYRKANLEHAAASAANLTLAALLIALLTIPLLATVTPAFDVLGVHPATPLLAIGYFFGLRLIRRAHVSPMWSPLRTARTVTDVPQSLVGRARVSRLVLAFAGLTAVTAVTGWLIMGAAVTIADGTGLSEGVVGGVFTAFATSSPELFTTIAAIRRGALTLAVSNIVGTNCFNTLVIGGADVAYRPGSIYHAISETQLVWGLVAIGMAAILLLGMVRRETFGVARIGFESALILAAYVSAVVILVLVG